MNNFEIKTFSDRVELFIDDDFDLRKIFYCGQCFRWEPCTDGGYEGIAFGKYLKIRNSGNRIIFYCTENDFFSIWKTYFDLDLVYNDIRRTISVNDYMLIASEYGKGIRILNQEKWEALCSFIISQCNNIPRIKSIITRLCFLYGNEIQCGNRMLYSFPSVERIAELTEDDLFPIRAGYRNRFIINAAKAIVLGKPNLASVAGTSYEQLLSALMTLDGVGKKVASCTALFGFHHLDAFPIDTWMKKAIASHFPDGLNPSIFNGYAGIAQQYMFYYERSIN